MTQLRDWDGLAQNNEDIQRKFEFTFVEASHPEVGKGVFWFNGFDGNRVSVHYAPKEGNKPIAYMVRWADIDVINAFPTTIGAVPFRNGVLFLKRTAARQWQVGAGQGTGFIWDSNFKPVFWDYEKAQALYFPKYERIPIEEAVRRFEEKKLGIVAHAIDSTYWLARRGDKIVLYRNRHKMGSFVYGSFFLHGACRDFVQELWDDLHLRVKT